MKANVLLVDDEPQVTDALKRSLHQEPYRILSARSAAEALNILAREPIDIVISDERMPVMAGSEFLALVRQKYPDTIRIILTGQASLEAAVRAINEGEIYRFLRKPCHGMELAITIRQAIQQRDLIRKCRLLLQTIEPPSTFIRDLEARDSEPNKVPADSSGAVIREDLGSDINTLLQEIEKTLKKLTVVHGEERTKTREIW